MVYKMHYLEWLSHGAAVLDASGIIGIVLTDLSKTYDCILHNGREWFLQKQPGIYI